MNKNSCTWNAFIYAVVKIPCYHRTIKCLQDSCYSNTGLHINMTNEVKCGGFYAPSAFEHLILAILVHYITSYKAHSCYLKYLIESLLLYLHLECETWNSFLQGPIFSFRFISDTFKQQIRIVVPYDYFHV